MARPWVKLYTEMLHDPKVGKLCDRSFRLFISLILKAGKTDKDGETDTLEALAWELRLDILDLAELLSTLDKAHLVHMDPVTEIVYVTNWNKRQPAETVNDRVKRYRENKAKQSDNNTVTLQERDSNAIDKELDKELELDIELEEEKNIMPPVSGEYANFLKIWGECFPDKPQPLTGNKTLQGKLRTRLKSKHFAENWINALRRGSPSTFLNQGGWFLASWFLANDDNYQKVLNGAYDNREPSTNGAGLALQAETTKDRIARVQREMGVRQ